MTIKQFKEKHGVHITEKHTGKMACMISLSTSALCNKYCMQRAADPDTICSNCYSIAQFKRYKNMQGPFEKNSKILSTTIIPAADMPVINARVFRLEAFGDLINDIHFINYISLAAKNPKTIFALWTKNPGIIERVLKEGYKKPRNMIVIYSSPFLNNPVNTEKYLKQWPFIDKFFTVYDKETAAAEKININCGARSCLDCGRCYNKRTGKTVNELLK